MVCLYFCFCRFCWCVRDFVDLLFFIVIWILCVLEVCSLIGVVFMKFWCFGKLDIDFLVIYDGFFIDLFGWKVLWWCLCIDEVFNEFLVNSCGELFIWFGVNILFIIFVILGIFGWCVKCIGFWKNFLSFVIFIFWMIFGWIGFINKELGLVILVVFGFIKWWVLERDFKFLYKFMWLFCFLLYERECKGVFINIWFNGWCGLWGWWGFIFLCMFGGLSKFCFCWCVCDIFSGFVREGLVLLF